MKVCALVVDDSKVMRGIVVSTVNSSQLAEFEFIEAESGEDALSKFDPATIDIIFTDWNMPKMTGLDFVKEVRKRTGGEEVPIIMVTSEKAMGKMEQALDEAGASAYICKPFTSEDVVRALSKFIEDIAQKKQKASKGGFFGKLLGGG
jgi:two-component system, chemotaxis family, chemotaxis protein CheY